VQRKTQGKGKDLPQCEHAEIEYKYKDYEIICVDIFISLGGMDSDSNFDGRSEGLIKLQNSDGELLVSCKCF
jgi:hypothetical protein